MHRIVNSVLAEADLLEIWLYTAEEWNLPQADKYRAQIGNAINNVNNHRIKPVAWNSG